VALGVRVRGLGTVVAGVVEEVQQRVADALRVRQRVELAALDDGRRRVLVEAVEPQEERRRRVEGRLAELRAEPERRREAGAARVACVETKSSTRLQCARMRPC